MISVNVYRLPCVCSEVNGEINASDECILGPDISDAMIETAGVAVARGTAEINENCTHRVKVAGGTFYTTFHTPGLKCNFTDIEIGDFNTIIEKSAISITRTLRGDYKATLNLVLEREE